MSSRAIPSRYIQELSLQDDRARVNVYTMFASMLMSSLQLPCRKYFPMAVLLALVSAVSGDHERFVDARSGSASERAKI